MSSCLLNIFWERKKCDSAAINIFHSAFVLSVIIRNPCLLRQSYTNVSVVNIYTRIFLVFPPHVGIAVSFIITHTCVYLEHAEMFKLPNPNSQPQPHRPLHRTKFLLIQKGKERAITYAVKICSVSLSACFSHWLAELVCMPSKAVMNLKCIMYMNWLNVCMRLLDCDTMHLLACDFYIHCTYGNWVCKRPLCA